MREHNFLKNYEDIEEELEKLPAMDKDSSHLVKQFLKEVKELLDNRQKLIRLADQSLVELDELAEDSGDKKHITEKSVSKKIKFLVF